MQADPSDFKKVHPVGETGGSILPDSAASSTDKPAAAASGSKATTGTTGGSSTGQAQQSPGEFLEQKLNELKQTQPGEFLESKLNELKDKFGGAKK